MQKIIFSLAFVFFIFMTVHAQELHRCGTVDYVHLIDQKNPGFKASADQVWKQTIAQNQIAKETMTDSVLRIPVVVHVVYNTPAQNLHDSIIHNQIAILNRDFNRQNADSANLRSIYGNVGKGASIEFYLATTDTLGNPTTGIVRKSTSQAAFALDVLAGTYDGIEDVKKAAFGSVAWDPANYLNIWVCNMAIEFFGTVQEGALLGLATPPTNPLPSNWPAGSTDGISDGVVIYWKVFGDNNPNLATDPNLVGIADQGRTPVHEVGHYLGLRHIWGDKGNALTGAADCTTDNDGDGIADDDGMSDTPFCGSNSQTDGCITSKNTCTYETPDLPDMWENYMDYSKESCQNTFTAQQVAHMRSILLNQRIDLVTGNPVSAIVELSKPDFSIQPNPSQGVFHIYTQDAQDIQSIKIFDSKGTLVLSQLPKPAANTFMIDMKDFAKGMYLVQVSNANTTVAKKMIVE